HLKTTKPELQTVFKEMFAYYWTGGIAEDQTHRYFYAEPTPAVEHKHKAVAPYQYWARALDFYTQMMSAVDVHIGQVIHNIPEELADNTVIVFSADHGELASSHGLQGKGASVYEECFKVPLVVHDLGGRFAKEPDKERDQLACSVDLLRMLVTLGHGGSTEWLRTNPDYNAMYGDGIRADLYSILQNPDAPGRDYVIYSTDEFFSLTQDYLHAPQHVIGLLTSDRVDGLNPGKLGFYHHWLPDTTRWDEKKKTETEFYDYATEDGRTELDNTTGTDEAKRSEKFLLRAITEQLKRPLPGRYKPAHERAILEYWKFVKRADVQAIVSTAFA
ncbi:MAG TPA: sulfatase-like hydrolase/transferase, partial [Blastocatellia bacterium]|nr:sulfatase-like hydrolase/transferase [Blastocatellia bacterium]